MAATSVDALGAFTHLQTNLPLWVTRISELAAHTARRHEEYTQAYRQHATNKPRRRKNSSVRSIHTDVVPIAQRKTPNPEPTTVTPSTEKTATENTTIATEGSRDASASNQQARRKRGPDESSNDPTEPYAFVSTRHNVIIEYDGHTQKTLQEMVKDIGIARNNIRRGRMSLMPRANLRSSLLSRTANYTNRQTESEESPLSILSTVRSTRNGASLVGISGSMGMRKDSTFDYADKQLELAHGLCETAAFQVLRSGDCGTELDGVEEKFKMLLEVTHNEVTRLLEEKKKQEEQAKEQKEKETEQENVKPPLEPTTVPLAKLAAITSKPSVTGSGAIEVDDGSSISAESLDLSAFRSSRIRV
ncbi:hypothetical protein N7495_005350 [Penicillium taxi]|uniref:uncharacterized protein n=1 Tax=Penicillium taxi TaxID=168475 RepID=UPI0025457B79|nr:uncharacterized protein N7495_005350 [Penicillium taxi]KAJ5893659.1 hypothetical protein N7495_005350 [Penicillium taxi]